MSELFLPLFACTEYIFVYFKRSGSFERWKFGIPFLVSLYTTCVYRENMRIYFCGWFIYIHTHWGIVFKVVFLLAGDKLWDRLVSTQWVNEHVCGLCRAQCKNRKFLGHAWVSLVARYNQSTRDCTRVFKSLCDVQMACLGLVYWSKQWLSQRLLWRCVQ